MRSLWIAALLLTAAFADSSTTTTTSDSTDATTAAFTTVSGTGDPFTIDQASGSVTYPSVTTTITLSTDGSATTATTNATDSYTTTSGSVTILVGTQGISTLLPNATATSTTAASNSTSTTSSSPLPSNTQPCNGYVEFCDRSYSNITWVAAHNSPFDVKGNIASNQMYPVTTQLNDGIRMLQFQAHRQNETMYLCHTSCDLLNAGTLEDYLTTVVTWLAKNPYEVITILIGNYDLVNVGNFTAPIVNSGLSKYAYQPPKIPMGLDDWPVLSDMILNGQRAVIFMDYDANQAEVPYILDEFTQMWETPFSPTDPDFPCTVQRPPNLSEEDAKEIMYMANHNLNLDVTFSGVEILIPNTAVINTTNAVSGFRSLGLMADNCTATWGNPPNFLLVDYYNEGSFAGSVFEVAATINNVTYNGQCCGTKSSGALSLHPQSLWMFATVIIGVVCNFI